MRQQCVEHNKVVKDWDIKPSGRRRWLEERYRGKVHQGTLNLVGADCHKITYVTAANAELQVTSQTELEKIPFWVRQDMEKRYDLQMLDSQVFGTEEEILKNQRWVARSNLATLIQVEADKEYEERKDAIQKWYKDRVKKNIDRLLVEAKEGHLDAFNCHTWWGSERIRDGFKNEAIYLTDDRSVRNIDSVVGIKFDQGFGKKNHRCYYTGAESSYVVQFYPTTSAGLASICGCTVDKLPDVLREWTEEDNYLGNHILNNLDPMDWLLKNPWCKMGMKVTVYLSLRGWARIKTDKNCFLGPIPKKNQKDDGF